MGSEGKTNPRYNISMSRRTRKPENPKKDDQEVGFKTKDEYISNEKGVQLKQLIEGRCSLAQHFRGEEQEEEKQQDMVVRAPDQEGNDGVKLKKMVRNYARILSHMIKVKQESYVLGSWRKRAPSLKLIRHK